MLRLTCQIGGAPEQNSMITNIEDYFTNGCGRCPRFATPDCSTRRWLAGLTELRRLCRKAGLAETLKWGHPCYEYNGRNVAIFGAGREDFRLSFMNAKLLKDPNGVLEKPGPNSRTADTIRFSENTDVATMAPIILACLKESIGYAEFGLKPTKVEHELELSVELVDAMRADPGLAEAFRLLTPGRTRSYVIALSSAKSSATRASRIKKHRSRLVQCRHRQQAARLRIRQTVHVRCHGRRYALYLDLHHPAKTGAKAQFQVTEQSYDRRI